MTPKRRHVLAAACAAWPGLSLWAQSSGRMVRMGIVSAWPDLPSWRARSPAAALLPLLAQQGFVEGRNLELDFVSVPNYADGLLDQGTPRWCSAGPMCCWAPPSRCRWP